MAKVLIVEDDALMGRMYEKIFSHENHEVEISINGEEGLKKAKEWKPDIVLLDIMMPIMNGFQVLESMKIDPTLSSIPIVMLTNLAGDQDIEEAKEKGAADYIVKSNYTPRQILDMVKKILDGSSNKTTPEPSSS
jgi:CheY-like chemotaxis protein